MACVQLCHKLFVSEKMKYAPSHNEYGSELENNILRVLRNVWLDVKRNAFCCE
jgi:hypothetical protein